MRIRACIFKALLVALLFFLRSKVENYVFLLRNERGGGDLTWFKEVLLILPTIFGALSPVSVSVKDDDEGVFKLVWCSGLEGGTAVGADDDIPPFSTRSDIVAKGTCCSPSCSVDVGCESSLFSASDSFGSSGSYLKKVRFFLFFMVHSYCKLILTSSGHNSNARRNIFFADNDRSNMKLFVLSLLCAGGDQEL